MKVVFYFVSWLFTLFAGLLVGAAILGDVTIGLAVTAVAEVVSAPFILFFCIGMHYYLKKSLLDSSCTPARFYFTSLAVL